MIRVIRDLIKAAVVCAVAYPFMVVMVTVGMWALNEPWGWKDNAVFLAWLALPVSVGYTFVRRAVDVRQ